MIHLNDVLLEADRIGVNQIAEQVVQFSFGPAHICVSLDAAYEFQQRLAAFLAEYELQDYACASQMDPQVMKSAAAWVQLAKHENKKHLDS